MGIPCKTAAGHAELAVRQRGLSQRHRTLLFLVDGQRTLDEVVALGLRAGVPRAYIDELMALGLVVLAAPPHAPSVGASSAALAVAAAPSVSQARHAGDASAGAALAVWRQGADAWEAEDTIGLGEAVTNTQLAALDASDADVAAARSLLLLALRSHAPVSGAVTMLRVRRARHREALLGLLDEVQARLERHCDETELRQLIERVTRLLAS